MKQTKVLQSLKTYLKPGTVYRRKELVSLSSNIDRNLSRLVKEGTLKKLQNGLYLCPEFGVFGELPPTEQELLKTYLKDENFVVYGPSAFNSLGLGTTQLYNKIIVFNRKRHGDALIAGRVYSFQRWREAPNKLSKEFLVVELVNQLNNLAENSDKVLKNLKSMLHTFKKNELVYAIEHYGTLSTQLKFSSLFKRSHA